MSPATAELQRASLAIALDATCRAMEQPTRERCPLCGGSGLVGHDRPCPHCDGVGFKDDPCEESESAHRTETREDEELDETSAADCDLLPPAEREELRALTYKWVGDEITPHERDRQLELLAKARTLHREDDEPFACLTCEDTGEVEIQQRNSAGQPCREPWATQTIACPDCNRDGAR